MSLCVCVCIFSGIYCICLCLCVCVQLASSTRHWTRQGHNQGTSHKLFTSSLFKSREYSFGYEFNSIDLIRSQFCTCHDSWAVVACAKLWTDLIIIFHVIVIYIFTRLGLWAHKWFVKWVRQGDMSPDGIREPWIKCRTQHYIQPMLASISQPGSSKGLSEVLISPFLLLVCTQVPSWPCILSCIFSTTFSWWISQSSK